MGALAAAALLGGGRKVRRSMRNTIREKYGVAWPTAYQISISGKGLRWNLKKEGRNAVSTSLLSTPISVSSFHTDVHTWMSVPTALTAAVAEVHCAIASCPKSTEVTSDVRWIKWTRQVWHLGAFTTRTNVIIEPCRGGGAKCRLASSHQFHDVLDKNCGNLQCSWLACNNDVDQGGSIVTIYSIYVYVHVYMYIKSL